MDSQSRARVRSRLWPGAYPLGHPLSGPRWRVPRPGPPGYSPSFGRPRQYGRSKAIAQLFHSQRAVADAAHLAAPADPLPPHLMSASDRLSLLSDSDVDAFRASQLARLRAAASRLRPLTAAWRRSSPASVSAVLDAASPVGVHVALVQWLCTVSGVRDGPSLVHHLRVGFPLVGTVPVDPLAPSRLVRRARSDPASVLSQAPRLSAQLADRARLFAARPEFGDGDSAAIWQATLDEVALGRISTPIPWAQADQTLPVCRRFGVRQLTSSGREKLRVIDDFAENGVNDAVTISARIRMDSLVALQALARRSYTSRPHEPLVLLKADFKSAYRHVPVAADQLSFARILVVRPDGALHVAQQWAMPFGAIGAVYAWDRLASAVTQCLAAFLLVPMLRYVDDLFAVMPASLAGSAYAALHECVALLGLVLDPEKSPAPAPASTILGASVEYRCGHLVCRVDAAKLTYWLRALQDMCASGASRRDLVKMAGRLSFGCFAVWGPRVTGRLVPLFHALHGVISLRHPALRGALTWWTSFLATAGQSSSSFPIAPAARPPCVVYTDAEGNGGLGACLFRDASQDWWLARVPAAGRAMAPALGFPRGMPVFIYEAAAVFLACRLWAPQLRARRVLFFIDNLTVLGALRRGRSKRCPALNCLVHRLLASLHQLHCTPIFLWVPSRFNIADPPSRGVPPPQMGPPRPPPGRPAWQALYTSLTSLPD